MTYSATYFSEYSYALSHAFSVRCVKNPNVDPEVLNSLPQITTTSITNIGTTTASASGLASASLNGNTEVVARGICWSSVQTEPTIASYHVACGSETGSFSGNLTGLTPNTVYYVRAYATNSIGTNYGNVMTFTTFENETLKNQRCTTAPSVTDYDGNVYNTVQIGNQCWMRENLRTTHYSTGGSITYKSDRSASYDAPYCYAPGQKIYNVPIYGYLYNWYAATNNNATGNNVQGVCPNGWHLPTETEWNALLTSVKGNKDCRCNNIDNNIAKSLSSTLGWKTSSTICSPGYVNNNSSFNNKSGFSALPGGVFRYNGNAWVYDYFSTNAYYWSSTPYTGTSNDTRARGLKLTYNTATTEIVTNIYRASGLSVRCLKN